LLYGILGEDRSDCETLVALIRARSLRKKLSFRSKGYDGCGKMFRKGAKQIAAWAQSGVNRFVICYDSDGPNPAQRCQRVLQEIVKPSKVKGKSCILIPVQELEAWILADIEAVTKVFKGWKPKSIKNPESISSPKEYLEKLSRQANGRPRYSHATHNEKVAPHLDQAVIHKKCPSFHPLADLVDKGVGNVN